MAYLWFIGAGISFALLVYDIEKKKWAFAVTFAILGFANLVIGLSKLGGQ